MLRYQGHVLVTPGTGKRQAGYTGSSLIAPTTFLHHGITKQSLRTTVRRVARVLGVGSSMDRSHCRGEPCCTFEAFALSVATALYHCRWRLPLVRLISTSLSNRPMQLSPSDSKMAARPRNKTKRGERQTHNLVRSTRFTVKVCCSSPASGCVM